MSLRPHGSAGVSRGSCGRCTETKTLYMSLNLIFIEVIYNCGAGEVVFFAAKWSRVVSSYPQGNFSEQDIKLTHFKV